MVGELRRVASHRAGLPVGCGLLMAAMLLAGGCGTTRTTNTARSGIEQLLISDAIDRAVPQLDFRPLAGQTAYLDEKRLGGVVDKDYLIGSLRQHMLASGCVLTANREEATFIVEPRVGALGTDNDELLFGIPATNVPQTAMTAMLPPAIPELPIAKRRSQRGIAKLAVYAYRRESGEPAWQSGTVARESTAKDIWFFGAGPFNRGTIYDGTRLAGAPIGQLDDEEEGGTPRVAGIDQAAMFPKGLRGIEAPTGGVVQATAVEPVNDDAEPAEAGAADDAKAAQPLSPASR